MVSSKLKLPAGNWLNNSERMTQALGLNSTKSAPGDDARMGRQRRINACGPCCCKQEGQPDHIGGPDDLEGEDHVRPKRLHA